MKTEPRHWLFYGLLSVVVVSVVAGTYHFPEGWTRSFQMGMIYWPSAGPSTSERAVEQELDLLTNNAEVVVCQLQWSPKRTEEFQRCIDMGEKTDKAKKKFVVALEWLDYSRQHLLDGREYAWSFSDPDVQRKFLETIEQIIARTHPEYFLLGVEVNYLKYLSPDEFENFVNLYASARDLIKRRMKSCKVTVSFQYEALLGRGPFRTSTENVVGAFQGGLDILGVSSYPILVVNVPEEIPIDYYEPLSKYGIRIGIFETAWPTRPWIEASLAELRQKIYMDRVLNAFNRINTELVVWTSGLDTPVPSGIGTGMAMDNEAQWAAYLGLWRTIDDPKLAAGQWKKWLERSVNRPTAAAR